MIYGAGKTPEQMVGIVSAMEEAGQETVLITRLSPEAAEIVGRTHPLTYHEMGRIATVGPLPEPDGLGTIVIATGGPVMCLWRRRRPLRPRLWATGSAGSMMWGWRRSPASGQPGVHQDASVIIACGDGGGPCQPW